MNSIFEILLKNKHLIANTVISTGFALSFYKVKQILAAKYLTESRRDKIYANILAILATFATGYTIYKQDAAKVLQKQIFILLEFVKIQINKELKKEIQNKIITLKDTQKQARIRNIESLLVEMENNMRISNIEWKRSQKMELAAEGWSGRKLTKQIEKMFADRQVEQKIKLDKLYKLREISLKNAGENIMTVWKDNNSTSEGAVFPLLFLLKFVGNLSPKLRKKKNLLIKLLKNLINTSKKEKKNNK
jgi:hypothetical protein